MAKGNRSKHRPSDDEYYHHADEFPATPYTGPMNFVSVNPWSEWAPSDSGPYYYRGRRIRYEEAQAIVDSSRNSIVPDGQGGYLHYEFMSAKDVPRGHYPPVTSVMQAAPPILNVSYDDPQYQFPQQLQPQPQHHQQQPNQQLMLQAPKVYYEEDDGASGVSGNSGSTSTKRLPTRVIGVDQTPEGDIKITFPNVSDEQVIVHGRKSKRRPDREKKYHASHNSKVDKWLGRQY